MLAQKNANYGSLRDNKNEIDTIGKPCCSLRAITTKPRLGNKTF